MLRLLCLPKQIYRRRLLPSAGDKLREQGLMVPPMNDRSKPIPRPNMQAGFITALVLPLWAHLVEPAFAQVLDVREIVAGMRANLARYLELVAAAKAAVAAAAAEAEAAAAVLPALADAAPPQPGADSSTAPT